MTQIQNKSRRFIRVFLSGAILASIGLMSVVTIADAKERKRIYNKNEFTLLCKNQGLKVLCDKKNFNCSCEDDNTTFIWIPPRDQDPSNLPELSHGPVGGDGEREDEGRGRQ